MHLLKKMILSSFYRFGIRASFFTLPLIFLKLPINFSLCDFFIFLSALIASINLVYLKQYHIIKENTFLYPFLVLLISFSISVVNSINPIDSFLGMIQLAFIFIVVYLSLVYVNNFKELTLLFTISTSFIIIFLSIFSIFGIDLTYGMALLENGWGGRYTFGANEPNIAARLILQSIPILLILIFFSKKFLVSFMSSIMFLLSVYIVIATASRSALLILLFGIVIFLIFANRIKRNYKNFFYISVILISTCCLLFLHNTEYDSFRTPLDRYTTIFDIRKSASSMERYNIIQMAFHQINKSPLIGLGYENSDHYTKIFVHNPLILIWLENGFLGIVSLLTIYAIMIFYVYKAYKYSFFKDPFFMALSVITLMMIFGDMFMANSYKRYLWLPPMLMILQYKKFLNKGKFV